MLKTIYNEQVKTIEY